MDEIRTKLKSEEYQNWVKSTLGMGMTKTAVETYVHQKFTRWTDHHLVHLNSGDHDWSCHICRRRIFCTTCRTCSDILKSLARNRQNPKLNFKNVDLVSQEPQPWDVAKLFLPIGNDRNEGPQDTDLSGMIHLMLNCVLFPNMKPRTLQKLRDARNTIFHSSDYFVTNQEIDSYFDYMDLFLQHSANDPDIEPRMKMDITAKQTELKELKDGNMEISMYEDAYQLKKAAIYQDFEERICAGDLDKVREILRLIEDIGGDIERLRNLQRNEEDVKEYKSKVEELEDQLKKFIQKDEVQKKLIRRVGQKTLGLTEQHAQLKRDVEISLKEQGTEKRNADDKINSGLQEVLQRHKQDILQVQMKTSALEQESVKLKDYVLTCQEQFSGILESLRPKLSAWQRALSNEASRLEAECLIVVVMVTIGMSLVLRVCLLFERLG